MTAEEFFNKRLSTITQEECSGKSPMMQVMIEFAKYHVTEALKAASKNANMIGETQHNNGALMLPVILFM